MNRKLYWPRELRHAFDDPEEAVRQALTFQDVCELCGDPLNVEPISCLVFAPYSLRLFNQVERPLLDRIFVRLFLAHFRCSPPRVHIDPTLDSRAPSEVTCIWRTIAIGFDEDVVVPAMVIQVSYTETVRSPRGESTNALTQNLLSIGMTLATRGELPGTAVGRAVSTRPGVISPVLNDEQLFGEIDLTEHPDNLEWLRAARHVGGFVLLAGSGFHLSMEGEFDMTHAIERGDVVWGWIDVDTDDDQELL